MGDLRSCQEKFGAEPCTAIRPVDLGPPSDKTSLELARCSRMFSVVSPPTSPVSISMNYFETDVQE
jgi:hypothetical protein